MTIDSGREVEILLRTGGEPITLTGRLVHPFVWGGASDLAIWSRGRRTQVSKEDARAVTELNWPARENQ